MNEWVALAGIGFVVGLVVGCFLVLWRIRRILTKVNPDGRGQ